jgi:hypothetical protein
LQGGIVITFAGLIFAGIGFILVTNYRGGRRWFPGMDNNRVMALFIGWVFLVIGSPLLLLGVVGGLISFVRAFL